MSGQSNVLLRETLYRTTINLPHISWAGLDLLAVNQYFVHILSPVTDNCPSQRKEKRIYVTRPGIDPRTSDLRVRCPTDCSTRPGRSGSENIGTPFGCLSAHLSVCPSICPYHFRVNSISPEPFERFSLW